MGFGTAGAQFRRNDDLVEAILQTECVDLVPLGCRWAVGDQAEFVLALQSCQRGVGVRMQCDRRAMCALGFDYAADQAFILRQTTLGQ